MRGSTQELLRRARAEETGNEVVLINARRYDEYDGGNDRNRFGYLQLRAELEGVRHDGVRFYRAVRASYYTRRGERTLRKTAQPASNVMEIGLVPLDWIEHVDLAGDEYKGAPIFFRRFLGRRKQPYKSFSFTEAEPSGTIGSHKRPYYPEVAVRNASPGLRELFSHALARRRLEIHDRATRRRHDRNA